VAAALKHDPNICSTFFLRRARDGGSIPRRVILFPMQRFAIVPAVLVLTSYAAAADVHNAFDAILRERVTADGLVDYAAIKRHDVEQLGQYRNTLEQADTAKLTRDEQLARYINLYNATVIHAVADCARDGYSVAEREFALFKEPLVHLGERKYVSLDHLEHEIIRKQFKDPRIHVALACAARSCPPLLNRAYRAADLDQVLDANMKRFVTDALRNQIDEAKRELRLSKIFEWYADDFGGKDAVAAYVARYAGKDVAGYRVSYLEYDWTLNAQGK
jgi:hypothetical protein